MERSGPAASISGGGRRSTGVIKATGTVWEAKHTSAFAKADEVLERYMPSSSTTSRLPVISRRLSVIFGNHKFEVFEIAADWLYQTELWQPRRISGTVWRHGKRARCR